MVSNKKQDIFNKHTSKVGLVLTVGSVVAPTFLGTIPQNTVEAAPAYVSPQGRFYPGYRAVRNFDDWSTTDWIYYDRVNGQKNGEGGYQAMGPLKYASWLVGEPRDITPSDWGAGSEDAQIFTPGGVSLHQIIDHTHSELKVDSEGNAILHLEGDASLYQLFHHTEKNHKTAILIKEKNSSTPKVYPVTLTKTSSTASHDVGYNGLNEYTQDPIPIEYSFGTESNPNTGDPKGLGVGFSNYFQDEYNASYRGTPFTVKDSSNLVYNVQGEYNFGKSFIPNQVAKLCGLGIIGARDSLNYYDNQACEYLMDYSGFEVDIPLTELIEDPTKEYEFEMVIALSMYKGNGQSQVASSPVNLAAALPSKEVTMDVPEEYQESNGGNPKIIGKFTVERRDRAETYRTKRNGLLFRYLKKPISVPTKYWPSGNKVVQPGIGIGVAQPNTPIQGTLTNKKDGVSFDKWMSGTRGRNMLYVGIPYIHDTVNHVNRYTHGDWRHSISDVTDAIDYSRFYLPITSLNKADTGVIRYTPNPDSQVVVNLTHAIVPGTPGNYDYSSTTVAEEEQFTYNTQTDKSAFLNKKGPYDGAEYIQYARINGGEVVTTSVDGKFIDFSKYVDTKKGGTINVELFYAKPDIHPDDPLGCVGSECGEIKVEGYHNMYLKKYTGDAKDGEKPKLVNHYAPLVDIEGDHIFMVDNLKSTITAVSDNNNKYSQVTTDTAYVNNEALDKFVNDEKNKVARYKSIQSNIVNSSHINPREKVKHEGIKDNLRKKYSEIKDTKDLNNNKYEEEILSKNKLDGLYKAWLDTENVDMTKWNDDNTVSGVWDSNFDKDNLDVKYRTDLNYHTALRPNYVPRGAVRYEKRHRKVTVIKDGVEKEVYEPYTYYYWDSNAYQEYDNTEITGVKNFSKEYEVKGKNPFNVGKTFGNLDRNVEPGYSKTLVGFESMLDGNKYNSKSTLRKVYEQFGYTDGSVDGVIPTQQAIPIGGKMLYMNPFDVSDMPYKEKANEAHSGIPNMMNSSQVDNVITGNNGVFHSVLYYDKTKAKVYFDHVDSEDAKVFEEYKEGNPAAIRGDVNQLALNPLRVANGVELSARSLPSPYGLNYTYSLPVKYSHDLHELKLDGVMAVGQDTGVPAFGAKQDVTAKYKAYYPTRKGNTTKAKAPDELVTVNNGSVLFTPLDTNIGDTIRTRMVVGGVGLSDLTFIDDTYNRVESYLYGRGENTAYSSARSDIDREGEGVHTGASNLITADDLKVKPDIYRVNGVRVGNGPDFNKEVLGGN